MNQAGWHPDPGGQRGMFRWWDGHAWTTHVTYDQFAPAPGAVAPGSLPIRETQAGAAGPSPYTYAQIDQRSSNKGPVLALVIVGVLVVGLIFGGWYLLNGFRLPGTPADPVPSNPTADVCPKRRVTPETATPRPFPPGRVQGGKLSYPLQSSPWGPVQEDPRVPFGRDAVGQNVMVHDTYNKKTGASWVASLLVAELVAGDGFFSPQQGSDIVTRCVLGVFYADAPVQRQDVVNQAATLDGHEAWLTEMHLTFNIPGLNETGETAIILIVATGEESSSLYYASIPDSRPDLLQKAREIQSQLRVES